MNRITFCALMILGVLLCCTIWPAAAIKCVQCEKCTDDNKKDEPKECSKIHLPDTVKTYSKIAKMSKVTDGFEKLLKTITFDKIKTCYKSVHTDMNKEVTIDRGCSPLDPNPEEACEIKNQVEHCMFVCEKDGCNSAPSFLKTGTITTYLLVFAVVALYV